ncbi:hypothetical protein ABQF35_08130 [Mycobacterium syngnathidarum]
MQLATASRLSSATTACAVMLMMGLTVIAFHQYWYRVTAALISLFGWFVVAYLRRPAARTHAGRQRRHRVITAGGPAI